MENFKKPLYTEEQIITDSYLEDLESIEFSNFNRKIIIFCRETASKKKCWNN